MTTVVATQVAHPWNATKRTMLAVATGAYPVLITLAQCLQMFADTYAEVLPGGVIAWAVGAATFLTLTAGLVTRIIAIPAVNDALAKINMDAKAPVTTVEYKPLTNIPDYPKN
jgi:hypothetical protein